MLTMWLLFTTSGAVCFLLGAAYQRWIGKN
jgi:hypothetical protein